MVRRILFFGIGLFASVYAHAQPAVHVDSILVYFAELEAASAKAVDLWGQILYGPVLLVDPATRHVYANIPDSVGELRKEGQLYRGQFPENLNMANTALTWNGVHWAMIMLPLSQNKADRIRLLAHESFHRIQTELGFQFSNSDNRHLDERLGRSSLRLELEALRQAANTADRNVRQQHVRNALLFRWMRHEQYPLSGAAENALEINEGLAEFTGLMISGPGEAGIGAHVTRMQSQFLKNQSFVRSFAYQTIPIYGFLLSEEKPGWQKAVNAETDLTKLLQDEFQMQRPEDVFTEVGKILDQYGWSTIDREEADREEMNRRMVAEYTEKLVNQPHLTLKFENMNVAFDPRNVVAMGDLGTVYPYIRVNDNWGVLEVTDGALMSSDWSQIVVSRPQSTEGTLIKGSGWTLNLNPGYEVLSNPDGNYILSKN